MACMDSANASHRSWEFTCFKSVAGQLVASWLLPLTSQGLLSDLQCHVARLIAHYQRQALVMVPLAMVTALMQIAEAALIT